MCSLLSLIWFLSVSPWPSASTCCSLCPDPLATLPVLGVQASSTLYTVVAADPDGHRPHHKRCLLGSICSNHPVEYNWSITQADVCMDMQTHRNTHKGMHTKRHAHINAHSCCVCHVPDFYGVYVSHTLFSLRDFVHLLIVFCNVAPVSTI